jgi:hypothetical protein
MPRKDPITGCEVMTEYEFWAAEAKHEGKGRMPSELMAEMFEEMGREEDQERQRLMEPAHCFEVLVSICKDFNDEDDPTPLPTDVIEVLEVQLHQGFGGSKTAIRARCQLPDGTEGIVSAVAQHWAGSRMEPPDSDGEWHWEKPDVA